MKTALSIAGSDPSGGAGSGPLNHAYPLTER